MNENYAYALGYYEGRVNGNGDTENCPAWVDNNDTFRDLYKSGYERGVSDYLEYDEKSYPYSIVNK